jgi:Zn-finger domain-containing protein
MEKAIVVAGNGKSLMADDVGSWAEYRKYVEIQLKDTAKALEQIRLSIEAQRIAYMRLETSLERCINGEVERRLDSLETSRNWAKGVGAVVAVLWSVVMILLAKWLKL